MVGGLTAGAVKSYAGLRRSNHRLGRWIARRSHDGAALFASVLDSFEASDATTITTAISAITSVQIALISGFTPSRTSE